MELNSLEFHMGDRKMYKIMKSRTMISPIRQAFWDILKYLLIPPNPIDEGKHTAQKPTSEKGTTSTQRPESPNEASKSNIKGAVIIITLSKTNPQNKSKSSPGLMGR